MNNEIQLPTINFFSQDPSADPARNNRHVPDLHDGDPRRAAGDPRQRQIVHVQLRLRHGVRPGGRVRDVRRRPRRVLAGRVSFRFRKSGLSLLKRATHPP